MLIIRAVSTATNVVEDAFFLCDLLMFHQLLPRSQDERWVSRIDPLEPGVESYLRAHGHPRTDRVVLAPAGEWLEVVGAVAMRRTFIASVQQGVARATSRDRLIILINGHGNDTNQHAGDVFMGSTAAGEERCISASDVNDLLARTKAKVTIIINSCFSGHWVPEFERNTRITVLTGCGPSEEIMSFPQSSSGKFRGGFFPYFLTDRFFSEYGLHLPKPKILCEVSGKVEYEDVFPHSNLPSEPPERQSFSSLASIAEDVNRDLTICGEYGGLLRLSAHSSELGTAAIGLDRDEELPLLLRETIPPSMPPASVVRVGGIRPRSQSVIEYQMPSILDLVDDYMSIVQAPPNVAANVGVETRIHLLRHGELSEKDTDELKSILHRRLVYYRVAQEFALICGAKWPDEYCGKQGREYSLLVDGGMDMFTVREKGRHWGIPRVMLAASMEASGISPSSASRLMRENSEILLSTINRRVS
jgi:hypothetical protein